MDYRKRLACLVFICLTISRISAQGNLVTLSGVIKSKEDKSNLAFVNVLLIKVKDSAFVSGTFTNDDGRYTLAGVKPGNYLINYSFIGFQSLTQSIYVGSLSEYLDLAVTELEMKDQSLTEITITATQDEVSGKLDKKTYSLENNLAAAGGSIFQAMQNLPSVTIEDGKIHLRGSDRVAVLVDGKQTALTGFGHQTSLDNIPSSNVDRIEIINNPSAKYDANGHAGIINIVFKKTNQEGWNGKLGLTTGLGALWIKKENLPGIRPQYRATPKINPAIAFNYRVKKINAFGHLDWYYNPTLNKNEFVTRTYSGGEVIRQQTKRNRNTTFKTVRTGVDWNVNGKNLFSVSGLYNTEKILDYGDEPFFNQDLSFRKKLWQFLEDEIKITATASGTFQHKFSQPGHLLNIGLNYTFHKEDEKYFFTTIVKEYTSQDAFELLSDEHVTDFNLDYSRPFRYGRVEGGIKYRFRNIPTNMLFIPGIHSPLDVNAGGSAVYKENIPAVYGNIVYENEQLELEAGLRMEYVSVQYNVDPNHNTYKSDGYTYTKPFPNVRMAYRLDEMNKISFFFNRRVDRPNELDIRVFPKYDDVEIVKLGDPALKPQFTNLFELGYKSGWAKGYLYTALYHRAAVGTITRIATVVPGSPIIYNIMQNAGKSFNTGIEMVLNQKVSNSFSFSFNVNGYHNQLNAFTIRAIYPVPTIYSSATEKLFSGNVKWNTNILFAKWYKTNISAVYLAPDLIPQGKIGSRFSLDGGISRSFQKGKGELFLNATDLLNTMVIYKEIKGNGFQYISNDYYETQVIRLGYSYKFAANKKGNSDR